MGMELQLVPALIRLRSVQCRSPTAAGRFAYYATHEDSRGALRAYFALFAESELIVPPRDVRRYRRPRPIWPRLGRRAGGRVRYGRICRRRIASWRPIDLFIAAAACIRVGESDGRSRPRPARQAMRMCARSLRATLDARFGVAFAGRLDYRRYGWMDRQIIRFIMLLTRADRPGHLHRIYVMAAVDESPPRRDLHRRQ